MKLVRQWLDKHPEHITNSKYLNWWLEKFLTGQADFWKQQFNIDHHDFRLLLKHKIDYEFKYHSESEKIFNAGYELGRKESSASH